jgi:hypothetical protein
MVKPLEAAFKMAAAWGYLGQNPIRDVKLMKEPAGKDQFIPTIEAFSPLHTRASEDLKPWLILGLYTGLRRSAIAALTRNDLEHDARELRVATPRAVLPHDGRATPRPPSRGDDGEVCSPHGRAVETCDRETAASRR